MKVMSPADPVTPATARWLTWGFRLLALGLGALHTLIAVRSQSMNEDGIGYLDLGDAFWQGRWEEVVNTTWSPLYAWIVGGVLNLVQPSVWWEFPTVQVTNFALYALTLVCFEYFWRQLSTTYYTGRPGEGERTRIPPAVWAAIGYSLFIYVSLNLIALWAVTPDMCVAAIVYLTAGQLLKLERAGARPATAVVLGVTLGVGYLTKAALFPLGLVLIGLAVLMPGAGIGRPVRFAGALVAFLIVLAPWAAVVSSSVGHLTFSDVGRFTYLKHVNGMPWPQWRMAVRPPAGTAEHPPRLIHDDPPVWEFAGPIGGTYPLAYDPAWWTRGLEPRVDLGEQLQAVVANAAYYFDLFVRMQGGFLAVLALLLVLGFRPFRQTLRLDGPAVLLLWALAAFGLYGLVYAESRYLAPFVLLFWAGLLARVGLPAGPVAPRVVTAGGVVLALCAWINIGALNMEGLGGMLGLSAERGTGAVVRPSSRSLSDGHKADHPEIAAALQEMGIAAGAPVAFVGYSYSAYWARLARLKIVAEIHPEDVERFWTVDEAARSSVLRAFRKAGAKVVVTEPPTTAGVPAGWAGIGSTGYLVSVLQ